MHKGVRCCTNVSRRSCFQPSSNVISLVREYQEISVAIKLLFPHKSQRYAQPIVLDCFFDPYCSKKVDAAISQEKKNIIWPYLIFCNDTFEKETKNNTWTVIIIFGIETFFVHRIFVFGIFQIFEFSGIKCE